MTRAWAGKTARNRVCDDEKSLVGSDMVIDATLDGNRSRFCNHSYEQNAKYFLSTISHCTVEVVFAQSEKEIEKSGEVLENNALNFKGSGVLL